MMFGTTKIPAFDQADQRPPIIAYDVDGLTLDKFNTQKPAGVETLRLEDVQHLTVQDCPGLPNQKIEAIADRKE